MDTAKTVFDLCPEASSIEAFAHDRLDPHHRHLLAGHFAECPRCAKMLEQLSSPSKPDTPNANAGTTPGAVESPTPQPDLSPAGLAPTVAFVSTASRVPKFLGPYRIGKRIGQGGMGTVYQAVHVHLKKAVAIKILPEAQGSNPHAVARFAREMEVVGRLNHPNIVQATDGGEYQGQYYLVMELLEGVDLSKLVRELGPLPVAEACEIVRQAALGMHHAHESGLVHRDLKPHNLMLTATGEVKVLDLGLACFHSNTPPAEGLTWDGQVMGTPPYMAPEQWRDSHTVDTRADVYSLGCTLYYLITGRPPIDSSDPDVLLREVPKPLARVLPSLSASATAPVDDLLGRVLAKDPADRPQTPDELACELTALAAGADLAGLRETSFRLSGSAAANTPLPSPGPTRKQTTRRGKAGPRNRSPRGVALSVAGCVLLVALTGAWWAGYLKLPTAVNNVAGEPPAPAPIPNEPVPGKWFDLLARRPERPPTAYFWDSTKRSSFQYDADLREVRVQSAGIGMITLGRVDRPNYKLKFTFSQFPWTGRVGIFYGRHTGATPEENICEKIELAEGNHGMDRTPMLHRARHTWTVSPEKPANPVENYFAVTEVDRLLSREYTLELRIGNGALNEVLWDHELKRPLRDSLGKGPPRIPYAGEFGFYCRNGSALLSDAQLLVTD